MRVLEFGTRTAHLSLTKVELQLVISGLIRLEAEVDDPHDFLDRTGTSPEHVGTLASELLALQRRMERLVKLEEPSRRPGETSEPR